MIPPQEFGQDDSWDYAFVCVGDAAAMEIAAHETRGLSSLPSGCLHQACDLMIIHLSYMGG